MITAVLVIAQSFASFQFSPLEDIERYWIGEDFYANNLQDWRVFDGGIECTESRPAFPARTLQCLSARLKEESGRFTASVEMESLKPGESGFRGFLIGQGSDEIDYRITALVHNTPGKDGGIFVGTNEQGELTIRRFDKQIPGQTWTLRSSFQEEDFPEIGNVLRSGTAEIMSGLLKVSVEPGVEGDYQLRASMSDQSGEASNSISVRLQPGDVDGGIGLFSHLGGGTRFKNFALGGSKIRIDKEKQFGPLLAAYYTVSGQTLKMTVQGVPLEANRNHYATLWGRRGESWEILDTTYQDRDALTYRFRVENWNSSNSREYKVTSEFASNGIQTAELNGIIRAEPKGRKSVAGLLTCFKSWTGGDEWNANDVWFPHNEIARGLRASDPDILVFTGDQIYEGDITPARRDPSTIYIDYLSKYQRFCWAMGDLMKDRPSIIIPDDHDVYQGNLWGAGGNEGQAQEGITKQDTGYTNPASFINSVHRSQTSHLPDPFDSEPVGNLKLSTYTCSVKWGGIDYAVLSDRQFKSSPALSVPAGQYRNGFALAEGFDPSSDRAPDAHLLGEMQERFLEVWREDWSDQTEMKVVVSQSLFNCLQVRPKNDLSGNEVFNMPFPNSPHEIPPGMVLAVDADSNGWPQVARDRAVELLRSALALHITGDQHLASVVQYGVNQPRDAGFSFCVPSVANTWPRRWYPAQPGENHVSGDPLYTGDYKDGFGNWMSVFAVANPYKTGVSPESCNDRVPGWGLIRFDTGDRSMILECWPRWEDPTKLGAKQYSDWPKTINQLDNLGSSSGLRLPALNFKGKAKPVIRVVSEDSKFQYFLKIPTQDFSPPVQSPGKYMVFYQDKQGAWILVGTFTAT